MKPAEYLGDGETPNNNLTRDPDSAATTDPIFNPFQGISPKGYSFQNRAVRVTGYRSQETQ